MLDPRVQQITLSGALDLSNERQLRSMLAGAVGDRSRELVVDLRGVTFIESSVLAVLVHAHQQLERQARAMACILRPGPVQSLPDASGLRGALLICDSPQEGAARVLGAQRPSSEWCRVSFPGSSARGCRWRLEWRCLRG